MTIRLLVSVRNVKEATAAVDGGADIIDVKEPQRGALGFAGVEVVGSVVHAVGGRAPVSVALGEIREWENPRAGLHLNGISYAKLGPKHTDEMLATGQEPAEWLDCLATGRQNAPVDSTVDWVAVSYADFERANAPAPEFILKDAIKNNVAAFLIDTYVKDDRSVFDVIGFDRLTRLRNEAHGAGIAFALAGQVREEHLPSVVELAPDIVGVRGAVCEGTNRTGQLSVARVRALKNGLRASCPQTAR